VQRPDRAIGGEVLKIYNELVEWGFLEKYSITESQNKFLYVTVIAMIITKSNQVLFDQENPAGKTAWEIIQSAVENATKQNKKKA
jgi:hypothetical protein